MDSGREASDGWATPFPTRQEQVSDLKSRPQIRDGAAFRARTGNPSQREAGAGGYDPCVGEGRKVRLRWKPGWSTKISRAFVVLRSHQLKALGGQHGGGAFEPPLGRTCSEYEKIGRRLLGSSSSPHRHPEGDGGKRHALRAM